MNQGIAFSRTLRALDADDFRASKLGLSVAAILLVAWTWWMFAARVPEYLSTTDVRVENGRAIANFASTNLIATGQPALLHFNGSTIAAQVESIESGSVHLRLASDQQLPEATPASADIETTRVSPAAIAFRTLTRGNR